MQIKAYSLFLNMMRRLRFNIGISNWIVIFGMNKMQKMMCFDERFAKGIEILIHKNIKVFILIFNDEYKIKEA